VHRRGKSLIHRINQSIVIVKEYCDSEAGRLQIDERNHSLAHLLTAFFFRTIIILWNPPHRRRRRRRRRRTILSAEQA
jgi:hypothetical protein